MGLMDDIKNEDDSIRIPPASTLYRNHNDQRAKFFEIVGLIEQLVLDKKGERIVKLCRYLDDVVRDDHENYDSASHKKLIDFFKLLINNGVKGEKLLKVIDRHFPEYAYGMFFLYDANPKKFNAVIADTLLSTKELKAKADKSFEDAMNVI